MCASGFTHGEILPSPMSLLLLEAVRNPGREAPPASASQSKCCSSGNSSLSPFLLADHFDTAFCEDIFDKTGARRSAPGADDNASATATLLQAALYLQNVPLERDIWIVHLIGEEYPADDLGIRRMLSTFLNHRQDFAGMILMDMIAWRKSPNDTIFQINAGLGAESLELAAVAMASAKLVLANEQSNLTPAFRAFFDNRSYLYNTDGVVLSQIGYPVVLFNEHINRLENLDRPFYHQSTDLLETLDIEYGASIARIATETIAQLAMRT